MEIYDEHPLSRRQIDENYYKEQILELRNSPNVINDLFIKWKTRFKSRQERAMLGELEEWYNSIKTLSGAQADAIMERMRAQDARIDFETANTPEYKDERKDTKILTQQAENEDLRARIAEAKRRQEEPKKGDTGQEGTKEKTRKSTDQVRAGKEKWFEEQIKDRLSELKSKDAARKMLDSLEQQELDELDADSSLEAEEKKERKYKAKIKYANMRDEIDKMTF